MGMCAQFFRIDDDKVAAMLSNPKEIYGFAEDIDADGPDYLDIDKAWAGIHFLLTGDPYGGDLPLGFILSGPPIGDEDLGMGPALAKRAETVKSISDALEVVTEETLKERFDNDEMIGEGIYAMGGHPGDDLEYLTSNFIALKAFIKAAADSGSGIIHYIS